MTAWQKIVLKGAVGIVVYDAVMSVASKTLGFSYATAGIGSYAIYFAVGYYSVRATGLVSRAAIGGGIVGLVDATIGWWVSWMIGPGAVAGLESGVVRATAIAIAAIWVSAGAALVGAIGGVIGRGKAVRDEVQRV